MFSPRLLAPYKKQVKETFSLKPEYSEYSNSVMNTLAKELKKEPVFVGVHIRRTDYPNYSRQV